MLTQIRSRPKTDRDPRAYHSPSNTADDLLDFLFPFPVFLIHFAQSHDVSWRYSDLQWIQRYCSTAIVRRINLLRRVSDERHPGNFNEPPPSDHPRRRVVLATSCGPTRHSRKEILGGLQDREKHMVPTGPSTILVYVFALKQSARGIRFEGTPEITS